MTVPLPGGKPGDPKTESPAKPFTIEDFGGLDTKALRPAILPKDFSWIENWMPIGPGNMRTLYAEGETLYTCPEGTAIIYYTAFNFGSARYIAAFLDDGSADQILIEDGSVTQIGAPGTFYGGGADEAFPAAAQYQSEFLAIASEISDDAYWIWDGTSLFGAGTLAPQITLLHSGEGYTSAPTVTAYGGSGAGATFQAVVNNGVVTDINVVDPGSGWELEEQVTLVITGGGSDNQARATATVTTSSGGVALAVVLTGGSNYTAPLVSFSGGGGSGAKGFVSGAANGVVTEITITATGSGYTSSPTVTITDSGGGSGSGATAAAEIRRGQVTAITVNNGGSGYTGQPDVVISTPNDFGFPLIQAEAYATITAGAVSAITITNPGAGYRSATVDLSGGNKSAEATVKIMPFGIQGASIETYQSRVWVGARTKTSFTGPSNVSDFSSTGGGGSFPMTDSFLRERLVQLRQSSGFLYGFGDSSIFVISNVQTNENGVTTFNNSNVDPQIGSAWRDSVVAFGRALVFANPSGVYALYGGAAEKVSDALDGLFASASFNTGTEGLVPTAAAATIFGIRVYMLAFTTTDRFTNTKRDILAMWDGRRWFVGTQIVQPTAVATQQINSELTAWGSDGASLYPLFQTPSILLNKVFQTKLVANPAYFISNQVSRVWFMAENNDGAAATLNIAVESESGPNPAVSRSVTQSLIFVGSGPIQFIGAGGDPLNFATSGLIVDGYDATQYGYLIGATVDTTASDLTMISLTLLMREYAPLG